MAWSAPGVDSWYRTASGRSAQNWPYSLLQYWELTRAVDPDDHLFR
jgi:4-hydroxyacetophenone monooxygenase